MKDHDSGVRFASRWKEKRTAKRYIAVAKPHLFLADIRLGGRRRATAKRQGSYDSGANDTHAVAPLATLKPFLNC